MKSRIRQLLFVLTGLIIITVCTFFGKFYAVDASVKEAQKFDDWVVSCSKDDKSGKRICALCQEVNVKKDKHDDAQNSDGKNEKLPIVATYQIGYFDQKKLQILEILPLGVGLQAGTSIISEDKKLFAPGKYTVCNNIGCYAIADLSDKDLDILLSSNSNFVGVINAEGAQVNIPISTKGLRQGLKALRDS